MERCLGVCIHFKYRNIISKNKRTKRSALYIELDYWKCLKTVREGAKLLSDVVVSCSKALTFQMCFKNDACFYADARYFA